MPRDKIKLVSKGKTKDGKPTRTFYTTTKTKGAEKLKLNKFDPRAYDEKTDKTGVHVLFEEDKIK